MPARERGAQPCVTRPLHPGLRRVSRELFHALLDSLCPEHCAACGEAAPGLCALCAASLHRLTPPCCARCGEPLLTRGARCRAEHRHLAGLREALDPDWHDLGRWVSRSLAELFRTEDHREGVRSFLEKRPPRYVGR